MPVYFPENNTAQSGDTAERSLQKISDLLKNGDVPIKINSVAVTGPFTVSNEVEVTNDSGNPLPVGGKKPDNTVSALSLTEDSALRVDEPVLQLVGTYTLGGTVGAISQPVNTSYPEGTVFYAVGNWAAGANDVVELRTAATYLGAGVTGSPHTLYEVLTKTARTSVGGNGATSYEGGVLFRAQSYGPVFRKVSGNGGTRTITVYALKALNFSTTGYPHTTLSSLLDSSGNLLVSDTQTAARLGNVGDDAPTIDNPTDKGLLPLFKRLLVRVTDVIDRLPASLGTATKSNSLPVTLASDEGSLNVNTGLTIGAFALDSSVTTLSGKIPSGLTVNSNRLDVNTGLSIPAAGQKTVVESLPVVLASDQPDIGVRGAHGAITTSSAELTTSNSTEVLAASGTSSPRRYLFIQNLSTAPIYVNFTNAATATSMRLDAGSSLSFEGNFIPNNSVNLLRSTTSNQRYFLMHATY